MNQPSDPQTSKDKALSVRDELTEFLLYTAPDGQVKVEVFLQDETIWLTMNQIADLFGKDKSGISRHFKNIFEDGELPKESTVAKFATVQNEGTRQVSRDLEYYNLDAIISVGYRVNSSKATQFRIWTKKILKEYIIKDFTMDDERLKNGRSPHRQIFFSIRQHLELTASTWISWLSDLGTAYSIHAT